MFARGFLSLHRVALSASRKNSANSNHSRTYEPFSRKSNYSRTYGSPGEGVYRSPGQTIPATPFPASLTKKQGGWGPVIPMTREYLLDYSEAEAAKCSAGAGSLRWTDWKGRCSEATRSRSRVTPSLDRESLNRSLASNEAFVGT